jgi:hypothetical protein
MIECAFFAFLAADAEQRTFQAGKPWVRSRQRTSEADAVLPELDKVVEELRAHYHACGLLNADDLADNYARAVNGMFLKSIAPGALPAIVEHFERLRQIHRLDIPFEERRALVTEHLGTANAARAKAN